MATLRTHLYSGLIPSASATARTRYRTVHFRQGDLDGSMLACSVFSALALMRLASAADVQTLSGPVGSQLREAFARSPDLFFHGGFDEDLVELLDVFGGTIRYEACSGSMRTVRKFALERLASDQLIILQLGVESVRAKL